MAALRGYLTLKETAERLGVTPSYVSRLVGQGRLEATRLGDRVLLIRAASVRNFKRRPRGRPRKKKASDSK